MLRKPFREFPPKTLTLHRLLVGGIPPSWRPPPRGGRDLVASPSHNWLSRQSFYLAFFSNPYSFVSRDLTISSWWLRRPSDSNLLRRSFRKVSVADSVSKWVSVTRAGRLVSWAKKTDRNATFAFYVRSVKLSSFAIAVSVTSECFYRLIWNRRYWMETKSAYIKIYPLKYRSSKHPFLVKILY